jgi:hypothetical protein
MVQEKREVAGGDKLLNTGCCQARGVLQEVARILSSAEFKFKNILGQVFSTPVLRSVGYPGCELNG